MDTQPGKCQMRDEIREDQKDNKKDREHADMFGRKLFTTRTSSRQSGICGRKTRRSSVHSV